MRQNSVSGLACLQTITRSSQHLLRLIRLSRDVPSEFSTFRKCLQPALQSLLSAYRKSELMSFVPRLHLVRFSAGISHIPDSFLVDVIFYIVGIVRGFIQKAVDDFIDAHQHLYSVAHLNPRRFEFGDELKIHRNVTDFEKFLDELRVQAEHHVCFLSGCPDNVAQMCVGGRVAVIHLPELRGLHYRDILSRGLKDELDSLGLCVGAALHEIGHLFGAFHSVQGIMGEHSSALSLLSATATDSLSKSSSCFFDSFTICIFVHGPFFNHSSADSPSVLYKISDDSVQVRCEDGLLLIVVVKGSNYCDLKLYDDRVTSVTLSISEDSWDFIQIYDVLHHVVSIRSQIKK